ncbi:MAG: apolipoprotein N-acyltransferase, partial [Acidobacteriota bacterium]|nr:apolipoprotein N-acyltransferase [Acidobacteriota bacterium]
MSLLALVPLLVALSGWRGHPGTLPGVSFRRGFTLGLLTGAVHFAGTVYWTGATVRTFGGLPAPVAVLTTLLLVLYMALFVALTGGVTAVLVRRLGTVGLPLGAAAWVSFEYLRGWLFGGFPWVPLGNSMVTLLPVAQLASVGGVYALSLLVGLINAGFAVMVVSRASARRTALASTIAMVAVVSVWGGLRLSANTLVESGTPVRVGLVQGNIQQVDKWNRSKAGEIVDRYVALTRKAVAEGAEFVVWPESATPFVFDDEPVGQSIVRGLVQSTGVPLLFGTDEVERGPPNRYFNSAYMLDTVGATAAVYRKMHLVPFGEYVPFKDLLFFVQPLVEAVSDFSPGTFVTMLPVNGHMASTAICYEVTYPSLMREAVRQGSELLTTITNDAWYGESSAPFQHFEMATMRAIEQGRYLVRAANTGISGIVDPYGRVLARTPLGDTTVVVGEARFVQARTLYATMGDRVPHAAIVLTALALAAAFWRPWHSS